MRVGGCAEGYSVVVAPVENPCAVCGELELEVGVRLNLVVSDFVYAGGNLGELVGFLGGIPAYAVEEIAVANAYCGYVVELVAGFGNACAGYGDRLCVGVIGNGYVAVLAQSEIDVAFAAVLAVPDHVFGVAVNELNDLYLIDRAVDCLDRGNGDCVVAVGALCHDVIVGSGFPSGVDKV